MPKLLAISDLIFKIEGRGTVVCLPKEDQWKLASDEKIHQREKIRLISPTGSTIETFIKTLEFINRGREYGSLAILLPKDVCPDTFGAGTEVWLLRDGLEPEIEPS